MPTKTKVSPLAVIICVVSVISLLIAFGDSWFKQELNSPVFNPNWEKDNKVTVEYKSWSDVDLNRPISIIYSPGQPGDSGVTSYFDFKDWHASSRVNHGTPVSLQAISGVTVKYFHVRLKVNGKIVCEKKTSFGSILCSYLVP